MVTWTMRREIKSGNWWASGVTQRARRQRHQQAKDEVFVSSSYVRYALAAREIEEGGGPWRVTLIRVYSGRQRKFDDDNLGTGFKHIRDGIADALKIDDGDESMVTWEYAQEKGARNEIRVEIV